MKLITVGISEKTCCIIIESNFEQFEEKGWLRLFQQPITIW